MLRPPGSAASLVGALLLVLLLLNIAGPAQAQISSETTGGPSRADTRRAQREARRGGALPPNFDTHLDRSQRQLGRGEGDQPRPEGADAYDYKTGNSPSASDRNIWGLRRKKTKPPQ